MYHNFLILTSISNMSFYIIPLKNSTKVFWERRSFIFNSEKIFFLRKTFTIIHIITFSSFISQSLNLNLLYPQRLNSVNHFGHRPWYKHFESTLIFIILGQVFDFLRPFMITNQIAREIKGYWSFNSVSKFIKGPVLLYFL